MNTNDPLDEQMGQRRAACTLFPEDEASGQSSCRLRDCQIPQKCSQKFSKALDGTREVYGSTRSM